MQRIITLEVVPKGSGCQHESAGLVLVDRLFLWSDHDVFRRDLASRLDGSQAQLRSQPTRPPNRVKNEPLPRHH